MIIKDVNNTIESLLKNKDAVVETFTCMDFYDWESNQTQAVKAKAGTLRSALRKKAWWNKVTDVYHVMMPVMYAIRFLDQKAPNLGKVWMTWWTVQRSLECPEKLKDSVAEKHWRIPFSSAQRKILLKYFQARWIGAHSPLHSAAYILDPEYWNMDLLSNSEVVADFYKVVRTYYDNVDDCAKCISELTSFRLKEGLFATSLVQEMAKEQPAWKWWMLNGGEQHSLLPNIAMKILSQCATNSSAERNWSMYKYIHSTIRNRLLCDRAEKLVYMYCNQRILRLVESEDYEEQMPRWMYDCEDADSATFDVGPTCSSVEIEQNLSIAEDDLQYIIGRLDMQPILPSVVGTEDDEEEETSL